MRNTFDRAIVEIPVCDLQLLGQRLLRDSKPMILGGNLHATGSQILHRLIGTAMTEFEFEGLCSTSE